MTRLTKEPPEKHDFLASGSKLTISLRGDKIVAIDFEGRPRLTPAAQKTYQGYEACHRLGVAILNQEIRKEFVGRSIDEIRFLKPRLLTEDPIAIRKHQIDCLGQFIVKKWIQKVRDPENIFAGDRGHNNFAGKLSMILKPYMEMNRERFEAFLKATSKGIVSIPIPVDRRKGKDNDFFKSVRDHLETNTIEVRSWAELCEWYFSANYDERPDKKKGKTNLLRTKRKTVNSETTTQDNTRDEMICRFKKAYGLYGLYADNDQEPCSAAQRQGATVKQPRIK